MGPRGAVDAQRALMAAMTFVGHPVGGVAPTTAQGGRRTRLRTMPLSMPVTRPLLGARTRGHDIHATYTRQWRMTTKRKRPLVDL